MANNSGNSVLDNANDLLTAFTGAGEKAAGIYSTFLGARANLTLAQAQKADANRPSAVSPEIEDIMRLGTSTVSYVVYAAVALVAVGGAVLLYRIAKK